MRILICDDDTNTTEQLQKYITEFFMDKKLKIPQILSYDNGEELLANAEADDMVFLDIEMPNTNGIYVGKELKKLNPNMIIFVVTFYVEYLDDAMRFHVFRYILKPLDKQQLFRNMKDAIFLYNSTNITIPIETKEGVHTIAVSDIIFVEAQGRTITVYTTGGNYISTNNMDHWINTLNMPCFFQSHRSFIVNMKYVTNFDHFVIHLYDNKYTAYLTKRKYSQFKNAYFLYLESTR